MLWTFRVSNHPRAASGPPYERAAAESWCTVYDGTLAGGAKEARRVAADLAQWHRHVAVFRGNRTIGKLWLQL